MGCGCGVDGMGGGVVVCVAYHPGGYQVGLWDLGVRWVGDGEYIISKSPRRLTSSLSIDTV